MLQSYFTIAFRTLRRNRLYALINVTGLGLGIGCALLLFALVRYHFRTDTHHTKYDRIYQLTSAFKTPDGDFVTPGVPETFGQALKTDHPEIEHLAMIEEWEGPMVIVPAATTAGTSTLDKKFKEAEAKGAFTEPAYFQIFDYNWVAGGPADLSQPGTLVLSAKSAIKYFGTTNALGRILKLDGRTSARVVGVFTDYADNTDYPYELIGSRASLKDFFGRPFNESFTNTNSSTHCFVTLNDTYTPANWNRDLPAFLKKHNPNNVKNTRYPLTPLSELHFDTDFYGVSKNLILSLFVIGLFLVITACINFVNLATAQAMNRAREVGVRKVMGSTRNQLLGQFMGETALIVLLAMMVAIGVFSYGLSLAQTYLHGAFRFTFYFTPSVLGWVALLMGGVILLAGLYPALVLAGFRPVVALAGKITTRQAGGFTVRRGLVVTQFAISQMLVIGLVVVASQLNYVQNKDLGFKQNAMLTIRLPSTPEQDLSKMATFRNLATAMPDVTGFSYSMSGPPQSGWVSQTTIRFDTRAEEEKFGPQQAWIDDKYVPLFGLKLVAGRNLNPSDTMREALVNEAMVRKLGFSKPEQVLGKYIHKGGSPSMPIVGVLKDFNQSDLKSAIGPSFFSTSAKNYHGANLQLQTGNYQRVISQLETAYNRVYPESYFDHQFVDDQIEERYQEEQTMGRLVNFFAAVALLIGCMGLYGLVLFMVSQRTKEIGVRKVLGASVASILWLFNQEFVRLIAFAFLLAAPAAWWVMNQWLESFQYRINFGPAIFVIALLATVVVAVLTVSYQSIKAALVNPVKSLRSE
ncbi:FtsX-like permease family protein [Fibrella forsythiae]|uniref:ABC transporter permease n=1 Tax=Fibrella forsythiae TaxID=2817061 RepID=A0ABS3JFL4_9BACT|nr:FtsX-like permease family protein [Fibrella forsythiae]MBO0948223.1 ABC transporter permease [Fibrella forsythiae]